MFEYCVCKPQISFGIFKINRIYFMRHGRRADLTFLCFLLEIIHRYIGPYITTEIDQDVVYPFQTVKARCKIIVMLNLCRELQPLQPEYVINKLIRYLYPVLLWKC